nr:uncharacterized protein LOC120963556 [Aegilops tauschii subsp. strangulata]
MDVDREARAVFDSLVRIEVGRGDKVLFWRDRWIHGFTVKDIAPLIHAQVDTRTVNKRTVQEGFDNGRWLLDLHGELNFGSHLQLLHLNLVVNTVILDPSSDDLFSWPADSSGRYTAQSTYHRLCLGTERVPFASCIWKSWALLKCKLFAWLAVQHRIWTTDRRARHGLQEVPSACYTCLQEEDNAEHILVQCVYAREVWHYTWNTLGLQGRIPEAHASLLDWWLEGRSSFRRSWKRGFDTLVIATIWVLWKQRNARVFNRTCQQLQAHGLSIAILDELKEWKAAGLGGRGFLMFCENIGIG